MSAVLRPMSTGELLDRTFNLYRNHFLLFAGISLVQVICMGTGVLLGYWIFRTLAGTLEFSSPLTLFLIVIIWFIVIAFFYLIGYALGTGATIYGVSKLHLGYAATIRDSFREMRPLVGRTIRIVLALFARMIGVMFLTEFVFGALLAVINIASGGLRASEGGSILQGILGLIALVTASVWASRIACRYSLAVPACLLEKLPARQALKRSRWLTSGWLGRIFLLFLLMGMLALGLYYALEIPVFLFAAAHPGLLSTSLELLGFFLAMILAFPIGTIAVCLVYYDQRVRKEAFDLQLMMEAVGQQQAQPAPTPIA